MSDSYQVAFTVNVGPGIDVALDRNPDGSLEISVHATSAVSIADAENLVQAAFGTLQQAWGKARS